MVQSVDDSPVASLIRPLLEDADPNVDDAIRGIFPRLAKHFQQFFHALDRDAKLGGPLDGVQALLLFSDRLAMLAQSLAGLSVHALKMKAEADAAWLHVRHETDDTQREDSGTRQARDVRAA